MSENIIDILLDNDNKLSSFFEDCRKCEKNQKVHDFLLSLAQVPIIDIVKRIIINPNKIRELDSSDVVQFSNFDHSSLKLCEHLKYSGNKGYTFEEIGAYLLDRNRSKVALVKYGENQSKTAHVMGLAYVKESSPRRVYISYIGSELLNFKEDFRKRILYRLLLRMKIVQYIFSKAIQGKVNLKEEMSFLSKSTFYRRLPNVKKILNHIKDHAETNLDFIFSDIEY